MEHVARDYTTLISRIKAGDDGAMGELVKRYGPTIKRMAEQMVGRSLQAHVDAEDAVQAVSVALWVGIRTTRFTVSTPDEFLALAKTLISRQISRYWRTIKSEKAIQLELSAAETLPDRDLSAAFANANSTETDEWLEKFLAQLDEIDQRLVRMRFEGFSTSEAARNLQVDSGFLRMRLVRLRKKFSDLFAQLQAHH